MRRETKGKNLGKAVIIPNHDVVINKPCSWQVIYTCGKEGIAQGGVIRITIPYGFTPPQTAYSSAIGHTTVQTSKPTVKAGLHLEDPKIGGRNQGSWGVDVFVRVEEGALQQGDTVTLNYGKGDNTGLTNVGAFAQYFEAEAEFTVAVDPDGTRSAPYGGFQLLDGQQPSIRVVADKPSKLFVVIPSKAGMGESIQARLSVRDAEENIVSEYSRKVVVRTPDGEEQSYQFCPEDMGHHVFSDIRSNSEGIIHVSARDQDDTIRGTSNPCSCRKLSPAEKVYWGDIHAMTGVSAGLSRPAEAYKYARDVSHLDFCATTDGDDDGRSLYYSDEEWEETKEAVKKYYEPGRFVTLLASEYHERIIAGDKNIYFPDDDVPLLRWSDLKGEQPEALWKALEGRKALTVPHHTLTGNIRRPWDHHHPEYQRLVEIYSEWGNSEAEGCGKSGYWEKIFDNSVQNGLARGYRMGIIASGDSHDGRPGNSSWMRLRRGFRNGLVAVYARELTREAVFDALWNRRCYGTSGGRILLSFTLNEARMGEELTGAEHRSARNLRVEATGEAPISEIVVVRNSVEVYMHKGKDITESFEWEDKEDFDSVCLKGYDANPFVYYYVRVTQEDGELAWSSPVWVSGPET